MAASVQGMMRKGEKDIHDRANSAVLSTAAACAVAPTVILP